MLDTDDVDDEYFTPIPSTSLASIFTNNQHMHNNEDTDNESLKYTPPKPQNVAKPTVESKVTECLLACALFAYEWLGDSYVARGTIGLAIIRNTKNNNHDIVLYDSNKRTLSCVTINLHLELTVKGVRYVSYHDNLKRYWTIYATEEEIRKILDLLKSLNAVVKYCSDHAKGPPEPNKSENEETEIQKVDVDSEESETDNTINTKNKISILNRMATMGQSVMPRQAISTCRTSDSSDNESSNLKILKHKPTKAIAKRMNVLNVDKPQTAPENKTPQTLNNVPLYIFADNGQLVPLDSNCIAIRNNSGMDTTNLMSEQRLCNSELRINMGRLTDKMDQMLDKIKKIENSNTSNTSCNVEIDLYKKLLSEYEYKIKTYENMLLKDNKCSKDTEELSTDQKNEQAAFQSSIEDKNKEINSLKKELAVFKNQQDAIMSTHNKLVNSLKEELADLRQNLASKEQELLDISKKIPPNITAGSFDIEQKLKSVMNDTFRTISTNFETDQSYSGSTIKSIIAAIIKKITLSSIK